MARVLSLYMTERVINKLASMELTQGKDQPTLYESVGWLFYTVMNLGKSRF